jgi:serine-type D-Ala-D-Ala carboxypeptidase (penicillin-binding protein 5/6)
VQSVLQPVSRKRRRRRRRSRRGPIATGLLLIAVGALSSAWLFNGGSAPATVSTPAPIVHAVRKSAVVVAPLLSGTPVKHRFTPPLAAKAAIVIDASDGRVIWALHPHEQLPIASLTKIMTGLLVLQHLPLKTLVKIGWTVPRVPEVRDGLIVGQQIPAWKLLYGLLLYSGNDDALALAIATGGSRPAFLALMNREAHTLGLRDTHYTSTSGVIDQGNYSSVSDLAALTRYALGNATFRQIVKTKVKQLSWPAPTNSKIYVNRNAFLNLYPGANGVKTGWTTLAGWCLVESATRHGQTLISVVLSSAKPYNDAARLMNFGYGLLASDSKLATVRH